jgi:hypothetical protein
MYDGTVAVYDMEKHSKAPIYIADAKNGKHLDPVWVTNIGLFNFSKLSGDQMI